MQTSTGEHHHQQQTPYYVGTQCDPNLLAYAQQAVLGYPNHHKNMYQQTFPTPPMPTMLLPAQSAMLQHMHHPTRNSLPSLAAAIPDMEKFSLEEPIEAGNLPYRKSKPAPPVNNADDSFGNLQRSTSSSHFRRHSAHWETMTDDEREMIQRQKRKEEAFKTALCDAYKRSGICPYGDSCRFAHGENELRMPSQPRGKAHPKYKTQLCDKFSTFGQCPYGPRCQFIHKLKKGMSLIEYNRALHFGEISPARDNEITNPDESSDQSGLNGTRHQMRRRSNGPLDMSDSGYSGCGGKRRLQPPPLKHVEEEVSRTKMSSNKPIYPSMQVVNIELATGQKKSEHRRHSMPSVIDQADYAASMASGKIFGKPENIRTYGAMVRASEENGERNQTSNKKERVKAPTKKELTLIPEEDTLLVEGSHTTCPTPNPPIIAATKTSNGPNTAPLAQQPWYEKIFGKKMTMIKEESMGDDEECAVSRSFDEADYFK